MTESWSEVWIKALTQPSVETFEHLTSAPDATMGRAFTWMFFSALIGVPLRAVLAAIFNTGLGVLGFAPELVIVGAPVLALLAVIGLIIGTGFVHLVARALGGTGAYDKLVYAFAAYGAPLSLIQSVLAPIPLVAYLTLPLGLYGLVLSVIAVEAVHRLGWGRAIASNVLVVVLVAMVVIAILLLLGPVVGRVYSDIFEEISNDTDWATTETSTIELTYQVMGTAQEAIVEYRNANGQLEKTTVNLPWGTTFNTHNDFSFELGATNMSGTGTIISEVSVDGLSLCLVEGNSDTWCGGQYLKNSDGSLDLSINTRKDESSK